MRGKRGRAMNGQAGDFIKDWQVLAQQSWDAWLRQLQPPPAAAPPPAGSEALERTLAGLRGCFDWMQGVAAAGASQPGADWQSLLRAWAGSGNQPFTQAFNGIDNTAAQGFVQQWRPGCSRCKPAVSPCRRRRTARCRRSACIANS